MIRILRKNPSIRKSSATRHTPTALGTRTERRDERELVGREVEMSGSKKGRLRHCGLVRLRRASSPGQLEGASHQERAGNVASYNSLPSTPSQLSPELAPLGLNEP